MESGALLIALGTGLWRTPKEQLPNQDRYPGAGVGRCHQYKDLDAEGCTETAGEPQPEDPDK
jgi:hypothetical protein